MNTKLTWVAGCLCLALALWIGSGVSGGGDSRKSPIALNGRVTKPYPRDRDPRMEMRAKNPREEFEAARKRGLTEEEVRWVVEDFLGTGISAMPELFAPAQELLERRRLQQRWYLDTLVEGFGLTGEQKKVAKTNLRKALLEDHAAYEQAGKSGEAITISHTTGNPFLSVKDPLFPEGEAIGITPAARMLGVSLWLGLGKLAPWNLCELDDGQRAISWFGSEDAGLSGRPMGARTRDSGTDERHEDLDEPFAENLLTFTAAGAIFPLSMGQVDRIRAASEKYRVSQGGGVKRPGLIDEVKCLTSSQLQTLLLFRPDMAGKLVKELGG